MPRSGRFVSEAGLEGYSFSYLPLANKGEAYVTMPGIGLDHGRANRDNCLLLPPRVSLYSEWSNAGGRLVAFKGPCCSTVRAARDLSPRLRRSSRPTGRLAVAPRAAPAPRSFLDRSTARNAGRAPGGRNRKPLSAPPDNWLAMKDGHLGSIWSTVLKSI
jgi:hypothetical protein